MYDEERETMQKDWEWRVLLADEEEARSQRRHFIDEVRQDADRPTKDDAR